ncbi:hypothetical protein ACEWY4_018311 [Coilia grayii]|uniref:Gypsy retrotransposon integrase-like protein 1 n=1 Tax=Coilia grayii TaxID=363190 RepID=A0ABD1JJK4_9TELE
MAGRGRGSRRAAVEAGEDEQVGTVGGREDPEVSDGSHEPTLSDLVSILQAHMAQQREQEVLRSREADQQWQTIKELQVQFSNLHQTGQDQSTSSPGETHGALQNGRSEQARPKSRPGPSQQQPLSSRGTVYSGGYCQQPDPFEEEGEDDQAYGLHPYGGHDRSGRSSHAFHPKLQKLTDEDDIEHFLITFERIARACRWPRADWSFHLIPLLTGKARGAYVHMDISDSEDYSKVKAAILAKYDVNAESYRLKFRGLDVHPGESPKELYVRLKELYHKWILPEDKSIEEVGEMILLEQYLRMVSPELQIWLKEHDPKSASEAAMLASTYVSARRKDQPWSYTSSRSSRDARGPSHHAPPQRPPVHAGKPPNRFYGSGPSRRPPICYLCGQEGHTKPVCPKNPAKLTQVCCVPRKDPAVGGTNQSMQLVSVEVNGRGAEALLDTGSDQTLIQPQYVQPSQVSMSDTVSIRCVHGDEKLLPTADVYLKVKDHTYLLTVGVAENLPFSVILGRDVPVLIDLLQPGFMCNAAVTRSQAKLVEDVSPSLGVLPFFDADIEVLPGKPRKSRRQRRLEKFAGTPVKSSVESASEPPLDVQLPGDIGRMQRHDPGLSELFRRAESSEDQEEEARSERYVLKQGVLYRRQGDLERLVVPGEARELVLSLGHAIPWAGHLGKHKTRARIGKHYFWPGMRADVYSLRYYLLGRQFTLETDHKALAWMHRMKDTNSRVTRWYLAMQPFNFIVHHVPGQVNVTADYLSRCPSSISEGGEDVTAGSTAAH